MSPAERLSDISIVILRTMTVEPVLDRAKSMLLEHGVDLHVCFSGYGAPEFEMDSLRSDMDSADIVMVAWDVRDVVPESLADAAGRASDIDEFTGHLIGQAEHLMGTIRARHPSITLLWLGMSQVQQLRHGQSVSHRATIGDVVGSRFNGWLNDVAERADIRFIDTHTLANRIGQVNFFDQRFWLISHMPFSSRGVEAVGDAVATTILHRLGRVRKALILDCDNTLWGGILDEVGLEGLDLSDYFPGNAFKAFQSDVLALKNQGILLGLCTRNDEENVRQVFESHPGMILKWNDIAVVRANWGDKAENLVQIAQELNIGLSSLVFVDDSAHEIDRVSQMIPDVLCVKVDPARPAYHSAALRSVGLFDLLDPLAIIDRTSHAHEQRARQELRESAASIADYQSALQTVVTIREATDMDIGRICDMARRTNQFHATGLRHSSEEVTDWIRRPHVRVRLAKLADRVGDLGDIGVAVIDVSEATAHIDAFLLSCRAIGRGVEWAMMTDALSQVGERVLSASVTETGRNRLAVDFIQAAGGSDVGIPHDGSLATVQIDPDIVGQQMKSWILQLIHMSSGAD